jgi:signal transduction histidine kinase
VAECDGIARMAADMMETLRGALFRLRPPDIDEFGLVASLEGLIAGWNGRSRGQCRFEIALSGRFEDLPADLAAGLYRIAQEAITNAAKHAGASRISLDVAARETDAVRGDRASCEIELIVADDGAANERPVKSGMGLLGMRERVASLGGRLTFENERNAGSVLRVVIPADAARRLSDVAELAA